MVQNISKPIKLKRQLDPVTKEDIQNIPELSKDQIEEFGRNKLGAEFNKNFKYKRLVEEAVKLASEKLAGQSGETAAETRDDAPPAVEDIPDAYDLDPDAGAADTHDEDTELARLRQESAKQKEELKRYRADEAARNRTVADSPPPPPSDTRPVRREGIAPGVVKSQASVRDVQGQRYLLNINTKIVFKFNTEFARKSHYRECDGNGYPA